MGAAPTGEFWSNLNLDTEGFPKLFSDRNYFFSVFLFIILIYTLVVIDLE